MGNDFAEMAVAALAVVMAFGLVTGAFLVIRDTVRKRGRWGINLRRVQCPECGEPAPGIRLPKNGRQALWGGCTCEQCGAEYDKWGRAIGR